MTVTSPPDVTFSNTKETCGDDGFCGPGWTFELGGEPAPPSWLTGPDWVDPVFGIVTLISTPVPEGIRGEEIEGAGGNGFDGDGG